MLESQLIPHPALVHFPLALLPLALVVDVAGLFWRRADWLRQAAVLLLTLGVVAATAAFLTGRVASDGVGDVAADVSAAISEHADWAAVVLWVFWTLAVVRIGVAWLERGGPSRPSLIGRIAVGGMMVPGMLVLYETGEHGGALVFRHGVGVAALAAAQHEPARDEETRARAVAAQPHGDLVATTLASSRLTRGDDGTVRWEPEPRDADALQGVVTVSLSGGGAELAVRDAPPPRGLAVTCSGRSVVWLPGAFADVVVRAQVRLEGFQGTVGLIHHGDGAGADNGEVFAVGTRGSASLGSVGSYASAPMDRAEIPAPRGEIALSASAIGGHLKGMVGGKVVNHAHSPAPGPGRVGFLCDGSGDLSIISIAASPVGGQGH